MSNDFLLVFFISPNDCPDECGVWLGLRVGFAAIFVSALFYALFIYFFKFQIMQNEFQKYKAEKAAIEKEQSLIEIEKDIKRLKK